MAAQQTPQTVQSAGTTTSEWEAVEALCAPAVDSSTSDWAATLEAFTRDNPDAVSFIDEKRVLTTGALGNVNVCGSDLSDWYVQTGTAADGTAQVERISDVILRGDHAEIARVVGQAIFDEHTRFGFGEDQAKCLAILQGISRSVAQDAGDHQLQNLPALWMPVWAPVGAGTDAAGQTGETGALGALQRFSTTPEAIQAISIAKVLENGPSAALPSICRPEPTTTSEWEQKRGEFCAALVREFPTQNVFSDGAWVEPAIRGLEELARLPKEALVADTDEDVARARRLITYLKERKIAGLGANTNDEADDAVTVLKALGYWGSNANITYLRARPCGEFSDEVMAEVEQLRTAREGGVQLREGFVVLSDLWTGTVDPVGSRDHDDAFSFELVNDGEVAYRMHLHITNVADAIGGAPALLQEAYRRGNTIYRPTGDHISMLPEELSHELLSLVEGKDREAVTISFDVRADGSIVGDPRLQRSIISVNKNLSFEDADALMSQSGASEGDDETWTTLQATKRFADSFRQTLENAAGKRVNYDSSIVVDGDEWAIKTSPQGLARTMIEGLSHAYSCSAAVLFEQMKHDDGDDVKALFRAATRKDEPHVRQNRELLESLVTKENPSDYEIAQMRLLQVGLMNRATVELSSKGVPHEGIGRPSMPSSSPLRDAVNLYNQQLLLALCDKGVQPSLSGEALTALETTSALNKAIQREDNDCALREMIQRRAAESGSFEAYVVSDFSPNSQNPDSPRKQLKLFVPELNKWYKIPRSLMQTAKDANRQEVAISATLALSGDRGEVTGITL